MVRLEREERESECYVCDETRKGYNLICLERWVGDYQHREEILVCIDCMRKMFQSVGSLMPGYFEDQGLIEASRQWQRNKRKLRAHEQKNKTKASE